MTQTNLPTKQKQTHRENRPVVAKGRQVGQEWIESLELADASYYI